MRVAALVIKWLATSRSQVRIYLWSHSSESGVIQTLLFVNWHCQRAYDYMAVTYGGALDVPRFM